MSGPLSLTCSLRTGESATSLVSRLATRNHVAKATDFCLDMGTTFQAIADGEPQALARIASLAGVSARDLECGAIRKKGNTFELCGERLWKASLRRSRLYACPHCLVEDERTAESSSEPAYYGRTEWLLDVMRACPLHRCALVEVASTPPNSPSQTHDFSLLLREQLRDVHGLRSTVVARAPSSLEAYVRERLRGTTGHSPWLDALDLHAAITTCEMLGVLMTVGPAAVLKSLSDDDWHQAGATGHAICQGGGEEIRQALAVIHQGYVRRRCGPEGPSAVYGFLYEWLANQQRDVAFEAIRDLLRLHMMNTMPIGAGEIVLGQPMEHRRIHSIWSASQETGRHPKRLRKVLAAAGMISADHADRPDHLVLFDAARAADFLRAEEAGLSLKQVETYLNAGRVQTKLLADHGLIQPHVEHQGGRKERRATYARSDLDEFLGRLLQGAELIQRPDSDTHTVPGAAKRANCGAIEIVRLILNRKLCWIGRQVGEAGYMAVLVNLPEIKSHVHGPAYDGITAREAEKQLMTSTKVVVELIRQGYLPRKTVINPINRCPVEIIASNDFQKFRRTYATIDQIAVERKISTAQVREQISKFRPAITSRQVGTNFYRRNQIFE